MANKRLVGSGVAARIVGIAIVLAAGVADADPEISFGPTLGFTGGEGTQLGGGPPGEPQFGSFFVQDIGTTTLVVSDMMVVASDVMPVARDFGAVALPMHRARPSSSTTAATAR